MPISVERKDNESFEQLFRRFKRKVTQGGFLSTARKKQFYEKPLTKRERKEKALRKKMIRELKKKRLMTSR